MLAARFAGPAEFPSGMRIGVPRETKSGERRVGLLPEQVRELAGLGHVVSVEADAGAGIDIGDKDYVEAGGSIVDAASAWAAALVVKVKELQDGEVRHLRPDSTVFSFQHLAGEPQRTREFAATGATAIAYEMLRDAGGGYPLLAPMSRMAGRMSIAIGQRLLGKAPRHVVILGAGHAATSAATAATALGARVTVLCRREASRALLRENFGEDLAIHLATPPAIEATVLEADLVIGAVFIPATPTPKLVSRDLVRRMANGAVLIDISIDAGGVAETSRPTTHADPSYVEEGVIHYCVANIPAAEPREACQALASAALPYVRELAARGVARAVDENPALAGAVAIWKGVPRPALVLA